MLLYSHQLDAIKKMHNGCVLCGEVGSGKSRTALGYYLLSHGGSLSDDSIIKPTKPRPVYIITTAKKRDSGDWIEEAACFDIPNVIVDSWNNIKKYQNVYGSFFIFDEQRVIGSGAWVKAFLKITRRNEWILLSATPGDNWSDYIPVFVANGFYKNRTEFMRMHAVFSRYAKYPKVERWIDIDILEKLRQQILVTMPCERKTVQHHIMIECQYDKHLYRTVWRDRWNPYEELPIPEPGTLFYCIRKVVNSDDSRICAVIDILIERPRAIIFYNFNYELEKLRQLCVSMDIPFGEWNGSCHQPVPNTDQWVYLVQYTAGAEGWNCTTTDTIIFYSQNYSYKVMIQAAGRIDRINTPFVDLYYYHLRSFAPIDVAIAKALNSKKKFNEAAYLRKLRIT